MRIDDYILDGLSDCSTTPAELYADMLKGYPELGGVPYAEFLKTLIEMEAEGAVQVLRITKDGYLVPGPGELLEAMEKQADGTGAPDGSDGGRQAFYVDLTDSGRSRWRRTTWGREVSSDPIKKWVIEED